MTRSALAALLALSVYTPAVLAQGVRGAATTAVRYIEFRSVQADTVDPASLVQDEQGRWTLDGIPISCRPSLPCIVFRPADRENGVSLTQDVRFSAWGLGMRGLSATAFLRLRTTDGDFVWPRSDDAFDALIAYIEYANEPVRVRLGRQMAVGGLGFSSYDGGSIVLRRGRASAEVYGGRSLARGLYEPRSEVLQGFENFVPDPSVLLVGGALDVQPFTGLDLAARYQREIFANRGALASERASVEAVFTALSPLSVIAATDYDFAFAGFGKTDLRARLALPAGTAVEARLRRYVPYFELWTIWGFFDPVGYREAEALVAWNAGARGGALAAAALRRYEETGAEILGPELERDTRRFRASAWWNPAEAVRLDAAAHRETGFGASFAGGDVSARWSFGEATWIRGWLTAFEQVEEFRVGEGSVVGGGVDVAFRVLRDWVLEGGGGFYRHGSTRRDSPDWNQRRAWLAVRVEFGEDPGLRRAGGAR